MAIYVGRMRFQAMFKQTNFGGTTLCSDKPMGMICHLDISGWSFVGLVKVPKRFSVILLDMTLWESNMAGKCFRNSTERNFWSQHHPSQWWIFQHAMDKIHRGYTTWAAPLCGSSRSCICLLSKLFWASASNRRRTNMVEPSEEPNE